MPSNHKESTMKTVKSFFLALAISNSLFANSNNTLQESMVKVQDLAWELRNASTGVKPITIEDMRKTQADLAQASLELSSVIADGNLNTFSELYKGMDAVARDNFHLTVKHLFAQESQLDVSERGADLKELLPGYGEVAPGYIWRLGKELERKFLHAYWKQQTITEKTSEETYWKVEASLAAKLAVEIPGAILGATLKVEIDGKIVYVREVRFKKEVTIETKQTTKWAHEEVWYEVYIAKKPGWGGTPNWQLDGKTFKMDNRPTGEAVVTDAKLVKVNS